MEVSTDERTTLRLLALRRDLNMFYPMAWRSQRRPGGKIQVYENST
jgi:hypothetical protein